jgi:hypothetical protein
MTKIDELLHQMDAIVRMIELNGSLMTVREQAEFSRRATRLKRQVRDNVEAGNYFPVDNEGNPIMDC